MYVTIFQYCLQHFPVINNYRFEDYGDQSSSCSLLIHSIKFIDHLQHARNSRLLGRISKEKTFALHTISEKRPQLKPDKNRQNIEHFRNMCYFRKGKLIEGNRYPE